MGKGVSGAIMSLLGAKPTTLRVTGTEQITDRYLRIHCVGPDLVSAEHTHPADYLRGWFPDPNNPNKQYQRGYTIRNVDLNQGTFDLDFVLHEPAGPASTWAKNCAPGDELEATYYNTNPFVLPDPLPKGVVLFADLAGYPAVYDIADHLVSTPETADLPVEIHMIRHHATDEDMPLPDAPHLTVTWHDYVSDGTAALAAAQDTRYRGWYVWISADTRSTLKCRSAAKRELQADKEHLHAHAYWSPGKQMGTSREN
ncbi:siderophore-interacting protein [Corynebacterium uberis]|uniref:siderophore-interacting protein n=1 Tax=Corynebacterium TaxID=1716 RepID=UPI001D0BB176|nr:MULTISPECIES: siderophore-interacting protein [Corynebacterium]MCZ9308231.1 siderophore-interacting protein [Corynebacterium sp. c6VSa_13]UDL73911.1 siderophore-interacting protein [Corynebacterium uberis]UDL75206.1 siderophore-interacting protein [Corynebacterium uberis]UDL77417.1 siderophore-interacting protein [Corynebacterium uberis]UDL79702.1 siderophore-interacting protein [Corynebacterium uberis]